MIAYLVMTGACGLILLLLWRRGQRARKSGPSSDVSMPGRGVAGEVATAMEDLAREIIGAGKPAGKGEAADTRDPVPGRSRHPK